MGWKCQIQQNDYSREITLWLGEQIANGDYATVGPLQRIRHAPEDLPASPTMLGRREDVFAMLQAIVDECWEHGIRPAGVEDFKRAHDVKDAHLQDMRAIVSKTVGVVLPGEDG